MHSSEESQIREILRKHLDKALTEITEADLDIGYVGAGIEGRLAEIVLQALAVSAEAQDASKE